MNSDSIKFDGLPSNTQIQFVSDGSVNDEGFQIFLQCEGGTVSYVENSTTEVQDNLKLWYDN